MGVTRSPPSGHGESHPVVGSQVLPWSRCPGASWQGPPRRPESRTQSSSVHRSHFSHPSGSRGCLPGTAVCTQLGLWDLEVRGCHCLRKRHGGPDGRGPVLGAILQTSHTAQQPGAGDLRQSTRLFPTNYKADPDTGLAGLHKNREEKALEALLPVPRALCSRNVTYFFYPFSTITEPQENGRRSRGRSTSPF